MGKATTFMIFIWIIVCIAGGVMTGSTPGATTTLTANLAIDEVDEILVANTNGFPDSGYLEIQGERIGYPSKTDTSFEDTFLDDIERGVDGGLEASAYGTGTIVRTVESGLLNSSLQYQVSTFTDSSGVLGLISIPIKFLRLIITFAILPLDFLGSDLQIISFIWMAIVLGIIVSIGISVAGGRRV